MPRRRKTHGVGALILLLLFGVVVASAERESDSRGAVDNHQHHHDYDDADAAHSVDPAVSCASYAVGGKGDDDDTYRLHAEEFLYTVLRRTSASEGLCRCFPTFTSTTTHASEAAGVLESKKTPKTPRAPLLSLKEYKADMEEKMAEKQRQKEAKAREKEEKEKERKKKKEQDGRDEEETVASSPTTTASAAAGEEVNATQSKNHTDTMEERPSGTDATASGSESPADASTPASSVEEKSNAESVKKEDAAAPESTDHEPTSKQKDVESLGNVDEPDEEASPGGELVIKPSNFTKADGELYNYASSFNGAKVIASNSDAKHASAALKEDKDVYYISPCASEDKFITVELSEEVTVTSVVLGNFEFHSSAVKDFELWGTDGHHAVEEGWRRLMVGRAENTKSVQKFVFPSPAWVHYVQIRITSHYDAQHFCTLSLLRVHGKDAKETLAEEMAKLAQEVQEVEQLLSDEDDEDDEDNEDAEDDDGDKRDVVADSEHDSGVVSDENASSDQAAAQRGGDDDKFVKDADESKSTTSDERDGSSDIHEGMESANATAAAKNATVRSATNDTATNASTSNVTANGTSIAPSSKPKLATGSEMTSGGGENVFRLLAQKIKDLELNQSLLSRYVESLNARYGETLSEFGVEIDAIEESVKNSTDKLDEASRKAKASSQACDDAVARVKLASEKLVSTAIAELEAYRRAIEKRDTALAFALTLAAGALVASRRSTGTIERILSAIASFVLLALCVLTSLIIARTKVLEAGDDAKLLQ